MSGGVVAYVFSGVVFRWHGKRLPSCGWLVPRTLKVTVIHGSKKSRQARDGEIGLHCVEVNELKAAASGRQPLKKADCHHWSRPVGRTFQLLQPASSQTLPARLLPVLGQLGECVSMPASLQAHMSASSSSLMRRRSKLMAFGCRSLVFTYGYSI